MLLQLHAKNKPHLSAFILGLRGLMFLDCTLNLFPWKGFSWNNHFLMKMFYRFQLIKHSFVWNGLITWPWINSYSRGLWDSWVLWDVLIKFSIIKFFIRFLQVILFVPDNNNRNLIRTLYNQRRVIQAPATSSK